MAELPETVFVVSKKEFLRRSILQFKAKKLWVLKDREFAVYQFAWHGKQIGLSCHYQSGANAAIDFEELVQAGAKNIFYLGTCTATGKEMELGEIFVPFRAVRESLNLVVSVIGAEIITKSLYCTESFVSI